METENPFVRTDSSDLGVCIDNNNQDTQRLLQELRDADTDRERAFIASKWIRACGDIEPVEGGELRACDEDAIWIRDGIQALREKLRPPLGEIHSRSLVNKTKEHLLAGGLTSLSEFGVPEGNVPVENGLLDLSTGDRRRIRPDDRVTWRLPIKYDPNADCPQFKQVLRQWVPDADARAKIQEFVGYALDFENTNQDVMMMLIGPTRTGKSTFLEVMGALFGDDNITNLSIQYLANDKWGVAELEQTPVNIRHDLDSSDIQHEGVVKELASSEPMKAERKNQDPFFLRPRTKHMFSANRVPECSHTDDAFYNRWLMVEFDQHIPRKHRDRDLDEKLTTTDELSGILNWAIEGYQRLKKQGSFTAQRSPDETRALWQKNGGSIDQFIYEQIETVTGGKVPKELVYTAYEEFAESNGAVPESKSKLTKRLQTLDGVGTGQRRFNGNRKWAYVGVKLVDR